MSAIVRVNDPEVNFEFPDVDFDQTFHDVNTLILSTMCANVAVVGVERAPGIRVVARGNRAIEVKTETSGNELKISAPLEYGWGRASFVSGGMATINGVLYIDGREVDTSSPMTMLVIVPIGTSVKIGMVLGKKIIMRNVRGNFEAKLSGTTNVEADFLNSADVRVSGNGSFICQVFEGKTLSVSISGKGSAIVNSGRVGELDASISGMGKIQFNGTVARANLSVSGMGSIYVDTVTMKLTKRVSGMGNILVMNDNTQQAGKSSGFSEW